MDKETYTAFKAARRSLKVARRCYRYQPMRDAAVSIMIMIGWSSDTHEFPKWFLDAHYRLAKKLHMVVTFP